jgi:hypothetical protein
MTRSALAVPFVEAARERWPSAIPPDFDYGPDVEAGGPNDDSKLQDNGRGLIQLRIDYPPPAELIGAQLYADSLEKVVNHGIGHVAQKWIERQGVEVKNAYWSFRGFRGNWLQAEAEAAQRDATASGSGWSYHPRESWAEFFGAALSGRWIVNLGASQGERTFNDGKPIDALAARGWIDDLVGGDIVPKADAANAIWLPSPNFSPGRSRSIRYIVRHTTQGTDSRGWLTNPASRVSAHYLVRGTEVYQLVRENDTAWHAGRIVGTPTTPIYTGRIIGYDNGQPIWDPNPNDESIGIEMEGYAAELLDADTLGTTVALIRDIRSRHGELPMVDHAQLSPGDRSDPGPLNGAAIDAALGKELDMDEATLRRIIREEVTTPIEGKLNAGFNDTLPVLLRRTIRNVLGLRRDPAGDPATTPPSAYPDDGTPIT